MSTPGDALRLPEGTQTLDLTEALREAVALEVPIKKLCTEDCRGICPSCGVNRNESNCDCRTTETDPRWDALKRLRSPSNPEE